MFVAIINQPGYLPEVEPIEFDSVEESWDYLMEEVRRDWNNFEDAHLDSLYEVSDITERIKSFEQAINQMQKLKDLSQFSSVMVNDWVYSVDYSEEEE